jgi:hypothetical protein
MRWLIAENAQIHYLQRRPMALIHYTEQALSDLFAAHHTVSADCSESITCLCKWAGLADPSGLGYDGYGNTQTMYDHLPHYSSPQDAEVGAIAMFGAGYSLAHQHVAMVMKPGADPLLFSHGSEPGPMAIRLSVEAPYHPGKPVFLSIQHL